MTEDWEQSHVPLDDPRAIHPPQEIEMVCCRNCKKNLPIEAATKRTLWNGRQWLDYYFCGQYCLEMFYLRSLRVLGM